jgi:hypothetical protein
VCLPSRQEYSGISDRQIEEDGFKAAGAVTMGGWADADSTVPRMAAAPASFLIVFGFIFDGLSDGFLIGIFVD